MNWDLYLERIQTGKYDRRLKNRNRIVWIQKSIKGSYLKYDNDYNYFSIFPDLVLYDSKHNELYRLTSRSPMGSKYDDF